MYDVVILGSGPAGLTAAIYTTRAGLKTLLVAGDKWGGQLMLTTLVENFPGFPEGIQGPDLMMNMRKQAEHHGAEIVDSNFIKGTFDSSPFTIETPEKSYQGKAIIISTGVDTKWLGVLGEKEKIGRGISSCAPCDAPFFRNKKVIVYGGGDTAMEEALVLTRFAEQVIIIYRKKEEFLKASQIMIDKVMQNDKIKLLFETEIEEIIGDQKVEKVKLTTLTSVKSCTIKHNDKSLQVQPGELGGTILQSEDDRLVWEMPIDGIFVAIGHIPNTKAFQGIDIDEKGFIIVHEHTKTNKDGVFVAGDVHDRQYMQAVTAAGFGCAAALEAERWLEAQK